jgi:hypothetical protein
VIKTSNPGRKTVELRPVAAPSRIRRDPPPPAGKAGKAPKADPTEREAWTVVTGVMLFAVALMIIILGTSDFLSH